VRLSLETARLISVSCSLTLQPAGSLSRLKRSLSRGFCPAGYPTKLLVSFRINRQLSEWNLVWRSFVKKLWHSGAASLFDLKVFVLGRSACARSSQGCRSSHLAAYAGFDLGYTQHPSRTTLGWSG
jgi:hypothetical protein